MESKVIDKRLAIGLLLVVALGLFACVFFSIPISEIARVGREQNELAEINQRRSKDEIIALRNLYSVEVLDWELSGELVNDDRNKRYDIVYLKITNFSTERLPYITLKTTRYNAMGEVQGWARSPSLAIGDLAPGETKEYTFKPLGSFFDSDFINIVGDGAVTTNITVEIESFVEGGDVQFFEEMEHLVTIP